MVKMAQRSRDRPVRFGGEICGTAQGPSTKFTPAYIGRRLCVDETHPGPPYRSGGPLNITKVKVDIKRFPSFFASTTTIPLVWYSGYMGITPVTPGVQPSKLNLAGWGAKGWNRTLPSHPIYQLNVSIGELKDLPHMVTQTKAGINALRRGTFTGPATTVREFLKRAKTLSKTSGDAYLYGAFGVYPMLQDLLFLLGMQQKLDKKVRWLAKHNGKAVRRKVELDSGGFSENIARSIAPSSACFPVLATQLYGPGQLAVVSSPAFKTYQRRIWYSAKYRYYIPELANWNPLKPPPGGLAANLLGLTLDLNAIYKLTPWSWLLDWFTSTGDVVANVFRRQAFHVVAEYAYVMCSEEYIYTTPGSITMRVGYAPPSGTWKTQSWSGASQIHYEFKQREAANPYGFGLTFGSLSAYQWSILAALGLSRGGKHSAPRP